MKKYNSFDEYMDDLTPKEKAIDFLIALIISIVFFLYCIIGIFTS